MVQTGSCGKACKCFLHKHDDISLAPRILFFDVVNVHPNFQPTSLIWELSCPQNCSSWCHQDAEVEAPEQGRVSLLPEAEFVVVEETAPVRSTPSMDLGDEL